MYTLIYCDSNSQLFTGHNRRATLLGLKRKSRAKMSWKSRDSCHSRLNTLVFCNCRKKNVFVQNRTSFLTVFWDLYFLVYLQIIPLYHGVCLLFFFLMRSKFQITVLYYNWTMCQSQCMTRQWPSCRGLYLMKNK